MTINSKQLNYILDNTPATQNIMLVGKHGIGKSRILEDYFSKKGAKVVTLFLGQMSDPGDLIGLPEKNEKTGKADFMLPYWFPVDGEPVVLFLDELSRARPEGPTSSKVCVDVMNLSPDSQCPLFCVNRPA